jgi:RNA polymerase sigma-70 factor (ECF subfamily)
MQPLERPPPLTFAMTHGQPEDRALVAAFLRSRSEQAFSRLYGRHTAALYRFAARLCGRPGPEASDLVQESWVRAVERLDGFRWDSSLRTWLCGIVLNGWREASRREQRRHALTLVDVPQPRDPDPGVSDRLTSAISELAPGYREVLILHDVEGFTHAEIARDFGIAEGTSKSQLHRARRALRDLLEKGNEVNHG